MKRRKVIEFGIVIGCLIIPLVAWILISSAERSRLTPPPTATTLQEFADCMPAPQHLAAINDAGDTRIIWIGHTAMWSLAMGPPCYVFDSKGTLIQWDWKTGEGDWLETTRFVAPGWQAKPMSVQEAIDSVGGE